MIQNQKAADLEKNFLARNQSYEQLNEKYSNEDYYWYLHSKPFCEGLLKPIGERVKGSCLDVGCGKGWLAPYVKGSYTGFDASSVAVKKARKLHPDSKFHVGRIESYRRKGQYDTVVFGNVFWLLIKKEHYLNIINNYVLRYNPKRFIVYDLSVLDTSMIKSKYKMVDMFEVYVKVNIENIKRKRKVEVYIV